MVTLAEVEVAVKANLGPLDKSAKAAEKRIIALERQLDRAGKKAAPAFRGATTQILKMGTALGAVSGVLAAGILKKAITEFATFEQGMKNVAAVSGATTQQLTTLSEAALRAAATTMFNPKQTTEALYALASSGQAVEEQMKSLPGVLDFAAAAQANLGQATEIVTSTLNVFGLSADQTTRVVDVFTASIGASALNANRIQVAMRNAGPAANALGQSFEGTTAALAVLTSSFGNGEKAGTGLKSVLALMEKNAKKMGINVKGANGNLLPLAAIIEKIEKKGITGAQAMTIFGQEAGPAISTLIEKGSKSLREMEERIQSTGQAAIVAADQMDTLSGDFTKLGSAISAALVGMGGSQANFLRDTTQTVTNLIAHWSGYADTLGDAEEATASLATVIEAIAALLATRVAAGLLTSAGAMKILSGATSMLAGRLTLAAGSAIALRGALAFVGGPIGAALLVVSGAAFLVAKNAETAADRAKKYADEIARAGTNSRTGAAGIREAGRAFEFLAKNAGIAEHQVALAARQTDLVNLTRDLSNEIHGLGANMQGLSAQAVTMINRMNTKFLQGKQTSEQFKASLDKIAEANPDVSPFIAKLKQIIDNVGFAKGVVDGLRQSLANLKSPTQFSGIGSGGGVGAQPSTTTKTSPPKTTFIPPKTGGGGKPSTPYADATKDIAKRTQELIAQTAALSQLNPLTNDYGFTLEKLRIEQELLNAAEEQGLKITDPLKEKISTLADEYASAAVAAEKLAESQGKVKAASEDFKSTAKDIMGGFITDLRNGVSASDALANALNKIVDKLIDIALNAILGGFGGGGGSLFSSLFARADGGPVSANQPYLVGERGPEVVVPGRSGVVVPNHLLKPDNAGQTVQQQTVVNMPVTINAPGADAAKLEVVRQEVQGLKTSMPKIIDERVNTRRIRNTRA